MGAVDVIEKNKYSTPTYFGFHSPTIILHQSTFPIVGLRNKGEGKIKKGC